MRIGMGLAEVNESALAIERAHVTQQFDNLLSFAAHLVAIAAVEKLTNRRALAEVGKIVVEDAASQIGEYQGAVGNYPQWEPLAESTEDEKARLGAPPDSPLYRFGDLQKSFGYTVVADNEVIVGSTEETMIYHEFGTSKMPPRPVLGPAVLKNVEKIGKLLGMRTFEALLMGPHLGYRINKTGGIGELER